MGCIDLDSRFFLKLARTGDLRGRDDATALGFIENLLVEAVAVDALVGWVLLLVGDVFALVVVEGAAS